MAAIGSAATLTMPQPLRARPIRRGAFAARRLRANLSVEPGRLAFGLLIAALAVLFIRPAEILPAVEGWPIYEIIVGLCCALSLSALVDQGLFRWRERPLNACVVWLLPAIVMSHLSHRFFWGARHSALTFLKIVVIYLLVAGLITSAARLRRLLGWINVFIVMLTVLALLQYHHVINIPSLAAYQERLNEGLADGVVLERLCSTGIFNDPNDLCLVLVFGTMLSLYWFEQRRGPLSRFVCLGAVAMFVWALALTHSRGGFLALLAAMLTLMIGRLGLRRSFLPVMLVAPLMFALFAGRQTEISATEGTGLARLQLWSEALTRFRQMPLFGMGMDQFAEEMTLVVHNSFMQCFVELGMFGGMLFLGAFVTAIVSLRRLGRFTAPGIDASLVRFRPYLLASIAGYTAGLLSLSRSYSVPTYLLLGITAAYLRLATPRGLSMPRFGLNMLVRFGAYSIAFVAATYVFVRVFVRWG